jgi:hypothetical protein
LAASQTDQVLLRGYWAEALIVPCPHLHLVGARLNAAVAAVEAHAAAAIVPHHGAIDVGVVNNGAVYA